MLFIPGWRVGASVIWLSQPQEVQGVVNHVCVHLNKDEIKQNVSVRMVGVHRKGRKQNEKYID